MRPRPIYVRIQVEGVRKWIRVGTVERDFRHRTRGNRIDPPRFKVELADIELTMLCDAGMTDWDWRNW